MTNATIAEIEEISPVERLLRLTYKDGEGHQDQSEQTVRVPDFADVVMLESAPDRSVLVAGRPVFMFVEENRPQSADGARDRGRCGGVAADVSRGGVAGLPSIGSATALQISAAPSQIIVAATSVMMPSPR